MNIYTKSVLFPVIFLSSVGSFITGFYKIAEPKSRFLQVIYGLLLPISITYFMFSDKSFFNKKQIL